MRFTALLLLATLVGALVCAHDTTTDYIQAATTEDSLSSKLEITAPAESTSLQETATAAQKTSGAAEAPARITLRRQGLNPLKSIIEKSFLLADQAFDGAEKRADEGIQDGKQLFEGGADFIQRLRKILLDPRKFWFLSI
ncbi:extracellular glycoprotein lacritin [Phyllostomus discolor]|uniref:Extracellular glycoprotein lacritin n=1 Tax=Phyllostomus discolor TaxID=89673 RepID=A0A7E6D6B7_9CHIR|nr:extracellular glycoprotein lacritin [Phyllostomus discolor]